MDVNLDILVPNVIVAIIIIGTLILAYKAIQELLNK